MATITAFVWWPRPEGGSPYLVRDPKEPSADETRSIIIPLIECFARGDKVVITIEENK